MTEISESSGAALSSRNCREFLEALLEEGFTREESVEIIAAWMSRPIGIDAAAYNAIMQNFAERLDTR